MGVNFDQLIALAALNQSVALSHIDDFLQFLEKVENIAFVFVEERSIWACGKQTVVTVQDCL